MLPCCVTAVAYITRISPHKFTASKLCPRAAAGAVEAATEAEAAAAAANEADDSLARSVGLHLRGRATFKEGVLDEEDPARFLFHRTLKAAAMGGNWDEAEAVVEDMARAGNVPGPRAYHALVCAYVRAGYAEGALGAIRRCWDASLTPLPETYAAVVAAAVAAGDLDTAEAVVASNRRAGVDCTRSWQHLVVALFKAGQADKGMDVFAQGEAEGLRANEAMYEALMQHLCSVRDLESAGRLLDLLRAGGAPQQGHASKPLQPGIEHYSPLILAHAEHGDAQVASSLMDELLSRGSFPATMLEVCYAVLEAQLRASKTMRDVAAHVLHMKAVMLKNGVQPGARFFSAQLEAALRLEDLQAAISAFSGLRHRSTAVLERVTDDMLTQLLLGLSKAGLPADLHEILAVMCREGRPLPAAAMVLDEQGCTILGAWVKQRQNNQTEGVQQGPADTQAQDQVPLASRTYLYIDGVRIDPKSLTCVDGLGATMAITRMGVRELRAELAARKVALSGNKKDLGKRVQKLRQIDDARASLQKLAGDQKPEARKVAVIVTDTLWENGKLVEQSRYESEQEVEALQDDEGDDAQEWDMEDEEGGSSGRKPVEDDYFDEDLEIPSGALFEQRFVLAFAPLFSSAQAGAHDAASILLGAVVDLGVVPSIADLQAITAFAYATNNAAAAVLLLAALEAVAAGPVADALPGVRGMREELTAFCSERDIDVVAAVDAVLRTQKDDDPLRSDILAEILQFE